MGAGCRRSRDRAPAGGSPIDPAADAARSARWEDRNRNQRGDALAVEDSRLLRRFRWDESEVTIGGRRGDATAWGASQKALLHEKRLVDLLQRPPGLAHGGGDPLHPAPPALKHPADGLE